MSRRSSVNATVCGVVVCAAAWWALDVPARRLPAREAVAAEGGESSTDTGKVAAEVDWRAFQVPIWVAPPAPPALPVAQPAPKPVPEPAPAPLRWQLLAIVGTESDDKDRRRAMLYDPELDSVLEFGIGEEHAGRIVEAISGECVTIRQGKHRHLLCLDRPLSGGVK